MIDTDITAYSGARIFDGERWHNDTALVVAGGKVAAIGPAPAGARIVRFAGGAIAPGFVDLQVNGGGGYLVGAGTSAEDLALVCATHAHFGATSILPTLITDVDAVTDAVISAGAEAARRGTPGLLGLHLEGPHLSVARKGAHDPSYIRPMTEADLVRYENARGVLPHLLITVAAEMVTPEQIARLVRAGIVVSIGHSDATYDIAVAAFKAGASMATHLFNAMSQMGNRSPGVVGAALDTPHVASGLIADGIHVHPAVVRIAMAAAGGGRVFLVSDSMSQAGTSLESFPLNGRTIYRRDGALRLADGTLAGADLTIDRAVRSSVAMGVDAETALRMASGFPARALGNGSIGRLAVGGPADVVVLDGDLQVMQVMIGGRPAPR